MDERRDDWKNGVDENLASLNAGQRIWEREQKGLRKALAEVDALLRGDTERETDGFIARLHRQETEINLLRAIIFKDASGNGGLIDDVKMLKEGREDRRTGWGNITKVLVAIITSGAVGLFWQDIRAYFLKKSSDPVEQMLDHAKHPKARHRHIVIRQEPVDEQNEN